MPRGFAVDDGSGEELDEFALGDIVAPPDADGVKLAVLYDTAEEFLTISSKFCRVPGSQRFGCVVEFFGKELGKPLVILFRDLGGLWLWRAVGSAYPERHEEPFFFCRKFHKRPHVLGSDDVSMRFGRSSFARDDPVVEDPFCFSLRDTEQSV